MPIQPPDTYRTRARRLLATYLKDHGLSRAELGRRAEVTAAAVSHYLNGRVVPDLQTAIRIERVTKQAVKCTDWEL